MDEQNKTKPKTKKTLFKSKSPLLIAALLGILVLLNIVMLIAVIRLRAGSAMPPAYSEDEIVLSTEAKDTPISESNQNISDDIQHISINDGPRFKLPDGEGDLRIEIAANCNYAYTLTYSLAETGQTILKTGLISPGEYLVKKRLDTELKSGEYATVALFTAYDLKTNEMVGEAIQAMTFYVDD
ncbi:MAG: hypothetical protein RR998_03265 [Oscillospiraceae bacterium]